MDNEWEPLLSFKPNDIVKRYIHSTAPTRAIFSGNQAGKTAGGAYDIALRLTGLHPVAFRNKIEKPIRCVSKVKPKQEGDEENQQYVELKHLIPKSLIKQDVTARSSIMTIRDPGAGRDKKTEFMARTQDIDAFMSVQRASLYQDEEIDKVKWDENQMRLLRDGGDATITLTPVRGLDWTFDHIWRRADKVFRSKAIADKFRLPQIEKKKTCNGIEAFCMATDDNPVMDPQTIERIFEGIVDPDELAMRRYGVFRQVSGRIYKLFEPETHCITQEEMFATVKPHQCWHYRIIDFHPDKPWNVSWVMISPAQEWFVWQEYLAHHNVKATNDIRDDIKHMSIMPEDNIYNRMTLIDPLAKVQQANTGFSPFDDLKRGEYGLRRLVAADTKNANGRLVVNTRLKNSLDIGRPGNNIAKSAAQEGDPRFGAYRPTIWFLDSLHGHIEHFTNWRYVDWRQEHVKAVKTVKKYSDKWSDYCRNIEFLGAENPVFYEFRESEYEPRKIFQGRS
jgi:hypothetical protein